MLYVKISIMNATCEVFKYYKGEPQKVFVVHHRNLNPADNDISNLQLLTQKNTYNYTEHLINQFLLNVKFAAKHLKAVIMVELIFVPQNVKMYSISKNIIKRKY